MSGHSHAATIKRDKEATDARKGAAFSKIANLIIIAVKTGGGITDPAKNFRLRMALEKAREVNMPKENVKRAIERGAGKGGEQALETIIYEGYGPGGSALMVECITDSKNRTAAEIKNLFSKAGGNLAEPGAAAHFFARRGFLRINKVGEAQETMLKLIDLGAEDIEEKGEYLDIFVEAQKLSEFAKILAENKFTVTHAEPIFKPMTFFPVEKGELERIKNFVQDLKAHETVQKVFVNVNLS